jgi:hypothetical protein
MSGEMSEKDDGGPAYPAGYGLDGICIVYPGMSLRDWLAGQEDLNDCAETSFKSFSEALGITPVNYASDPIGYMAWEAEIRAKIKYMRADAMLKARSGK